MDEPQKAEIVRFHPLPFRSAEVLSELERVTQEAINRFDQYVEPHTPFRNAKFKFSRNDIVQSAQKFTDFLRILAYDLVDGHFTIYSGYYEPKGWGGDHARVLVDDIIACAWKETDRFWNSFWNLVCSEPVDRGVLLGIASLQGGEIAPYLEPWTYPPPEHWVGVFESFRNTEVPTLTHQYEQTIKRTVDERIGYWSTKLINASTPQPIDFSPSDQTTTPMDAIECVPPEKLAPETPPTGGRDEEKEPETDTASIEPPTNLRSIRVSRRSALLAQYRDATGNPSKKQIFEAKNVPIHRGEFSKWQTGKLSDSSDTTKNFENFLRSCKPLIPRRHS